MIKHAIVYDDNKSILVVIMPVYAVEVAIFFAMCLQRRGCKAKNRHTYESTGPRVGKVGMGRFLIISIFGYWGS